ncbi:MAG: septum formation initiator family protein [Mycobacterium sp.]
MSARRPPASRPGGGGGSTKGRPGASRSARREAKPADAGEGTAPEQGVEPPPVIEPIRESIAAAVEQQSEQRLGSAARRAAILAAVVCVLTLTIAGPVRTYFAQRTEMEQLEATEVMLREQIAELEQQKTKLADPVFIAAQARERLGFVMPGDIPYQVQLPPSDDAPAAPETRAEAVANGDPWYTSLWHTIADAPHNLPPAPVPGG